jgi:hypothetical protein
LDGRDSAFAQADGRSARLSDLLPWALIILLAFTSCVTQFLRELAEGNKVHVENGREPNASVALFPAIPSIPIGYAATTWLLNRAAENLGFWLVCTYGLVMITLDAIAYRRARKWLAESRSRPKR